MGVRGLCARLTRRRAGDDVASHIGNVPLQVALTELIESVAGVHAPAVSHETPASALAATVVATCADNGSGDTQPPPCPRMSSPPPFPALSCHFVDADAERMAAGSFQDAAAACAPHARVTFNSREAQVYETDLFAGKALILLRPAARKDDIYYAERVFDGRSRCVEFQIQGRFKRAPRGDVYLGGEVSSRVQLGMARTQLTGSPISPRYQQAAHELAQESRRRNTHEGVRCPISAPLGLYPRRSSTMNNIIHAPHCQTRRMQVTTGVARLILQFAAKLNPPGMHYSFGDKDSRVLPHIVVPFSRAADRLIVTQDGEAPPELGMPLEVRAIPLSFDAHSHQPPSYRSHLHVIGNTHTTARHHSRFAHALRQAPTPIRHSQGG